MRTLSFLVGLSILVGPLAIAADPGDEAKAVVEKAIKAAGGAEKLGKIKAMSWKAKGEMKSAGHNMKYTADYLFASPDKFRFDIGLDMGDQKQTLTAATDGKAAWEQMGDTMRDMEEKKQKEFHHNVYVMHLAELLPLRDKAFKLTPLGDSKLGEQTLVGVKVEREGHREASLYFDKKTNLLAKMSTRVIDVDMTQKEMAQDSLISNYFDKDGFKWFGKLTIMRDGAEFIVEEMSDQKVLDKVDLKKFAKPEMKKESPAN